MYCTNRFAVAALAVAAVLTATPASAAEDHSSHAEPPVGNWRDANDAAGRNARGHVDILRAEEAQARRAATVKETAGAPVLDISAALRRALLARPDLMAVPGMSEQELLKLRIEIAELRHAVQRAWTESVLADEQSRRQRGVQEGSDIGFELAQRMTQVGNWSRARGLENELDVWRMRGQTLRLEQTATGAREALVRLVGDGPWRLPEAVPPPPALAPLPEARAPIEELETQALRRHPRWPLLEQEAVWRERALTSPQLAAWRSSAESMVDSALQAADAAGLGGVPVPQFDPGRQRLPHALESAVLGRAEADALARTVRSQVREARRQLIATHALAEQSVQEVQRITTALQEETLLRYNGMLVGTWDLLASAQARLQSEIAAAQARRDFWLALARLQALLAGASDIPPASAASAGDVTAVRTH
jgi:outer membrane protein TolC